jgi:hypothetical protein
MTSVDDTIWQHLVDHHGADGISLAAEPQRPASGHRRRAVLAGVGASVTVAVTAVVLFAGPGSPPAYAVTPNPDGSFTVTIHDLEAAVPQLNAKFASLGIDETVVPVEAGCPSGSASVLMTDPMFADPQATEDQTLTFRAGRHNLDPGYTGVIAAEQLPGGGVALAEEAIRPPVPTCFPTTVYTVHSGGTTTNGTPIIDVTPSTSGG